MNQLAAVVVVATFLISLFSGGATVVQAQVPDQVSASHILIQYDGASSAAKTVTRSKEEALELAQKVANLAKEEGADFAALAKEYSDGPSGPSGGNLRNFAPKQMVAPFSNAVLALEVGGVSDPVETQFGYHIILRQEVKPMRKASAKHILVMHKDSMRVPPNITRSKEEAMARCEEVLAKLAEGAVFEDLAREYSDGPSAKSGGDLGEFQEGRMVPAFEAATFECKVGDTTGIVETDFGYHIILRTK